MRSFVLHTLVKAGRAVDISSKSSRAFVPLTAMHSLQYMRMSSIHHFGTCVSVGLSVPDKMEHSLMNQPFIVDDANNELAHSSIRDLETTPATVCDGMAAPADSWVTISRSAAG